MILTIIVPVYNEARRVEQTLDRICKVQFPCEVEILVVDDGSSDGSAEITASFSDERVVTHTHPHNLGKGAAVATGVARAAGTHVVICDADMEYLPEELPLLLQPVIAGEAEVVYGTRSFGSHTAYSFWYVMGNKAVTLAANVLFDSYISDLETCYKLLPTELWRDLHIREQGFGMEAELTGKLLARGIRPYEVPISYKARSREEGKKLTWRDGVEALWILAKIRMRRS